MKQAAGEGFFEGAERLEPFAAIGRLIRKGGSAVLAVSDAERVRGALREQKGNEAIDYLSVIDANAQAMLAIYVEFVLAFPKAAAGDPAGIDAADVIARSHALCATRVRASSLHAHAISLTVLDAFAAGRVSAESVDELRRDALAGKPTIVGDLSSGSQLLARNLRASITSGEFRESIAVFDEYLAHIRAQHDVLVELISAYVTVLADRHGQTAAERVLSQAFTTCLFYEGLWALVGAMNAEQVAAFLADHLRGHLSGAAREGAVSIVDEADRYRLVFEPCGSGGALRQRGEVPLLSEASPMTWGRAREVPGYCTHCAVNELESVKRLGYPILVTEFSPDPHRPCGWTVYKDPAAIPDEYFTRLGERRDPARFVRRS